MPARQIPLAIALAAVLTGAGPAPLDATKLELKLAGVDAGVDTDVGAQWQQTCPALARALGPGTGPWGLGIATSFACQAEQEVDASEQQWLLETRATENKTVVALSLRIDGEKVPLASMSLPLPLERALRFLEQPEHAALVAARLIDSSPVQARVQREGDVLRVAGGSVPAEVPAPERLVAFKATCNPASGIWTPSYVADLVRGPKVADGFRVKLDAAGQARAQGTLWAREPQQLGTHAAAIDAALAKRLAIFAENEGNRLGATYVGARYGMGLLDSGLLKGNSVIGVVGEVRSGPVAGLQLSWDYWPRVRKAIDGVASEAGGHRLLVGWAFSFEAPWLLDSFDLTPKLGRWEYVTRFPVPRGDGTTRPETFAVNGATSVEFELGGNLTRGQLQVRGWHARAIGIAYVEGAGGNVRILTSRYGLDGLVRLASVESFGESLHWSALAFIFHETVTLARDEPLATSTAEVRIERVEFQQAYAGVGVAVSWD